MSGEDPAARSAAAEFTEQRRAMVERQLRARGIKDSRVLEAMQAVPRHLFVPPALAATAYADEPLGIGEGQTISQPYMVGAMTEALELNGSERVLEIGAGSGYQAAILSLLSREVIAVEARPLLAQGARERLSELGYSNVRIEIGDGTLGWPAGAPYDGILVSAAAPTVPPPLIEQLVEGGRLIIPLGSAEHQDLCLVRRRGGEITQQTLFACRFVPLVGRHAWRDASLS